MTHPPEMRTAAAILAACALATPALAGAPQPTQPVPVSLYAGRWFDIAHTPNARQRGCEGPTNDFSGSAPSHLRLVQTCHKGAPDGPAHTFSARASIVPAANGAKFTVSFFGGLVHQQYWILAHADDWAVMATPGGHYVWLLARRPHLTAAEQARALARIGALGYDTHRLETPEQGSG